MEVDKLAEKYLEGYKKGYEDGLKSSIKNESVSENPDIDISKLAETITDLAEKVQNHKEAIIAIRNYLFDEYINDSSNTIKRPPFPQL